MSYNGDYTPLVSVRHQFNSGHWLNKLPSWWNGIHSGLRNRVERRVGSSPTEGTNAGVSRCGNGGSLISYLVYPIAGSSPATGTKNLCRDGGTVDTRSSNLRGANALRVRIPLSVQLVL